MMGRGCRFLGKRQQIDPKGHAAVPRVLDAHSSRWNGELPVVLGLPGTEVEEEEARAVGVTSN